VSSRASGMTRRWEPLLPTAKVVVGLVAASGVIGLIQAIQVATAMSRVTDVTVPVSGLGVQLQDRISPAPFGGVVSLLTLVAGVTWLTWQHKAQGDLYARQLPGLRYTPGWAVGWWFVPFANLVMPYLTVRELWDGAGHASRAPATRRDWRLLAWWLAYISSTYLVVAGFGPILGAMFRSISDQASTGGSGQITSVTLSASAIHTAQLWTVVGDSLRAVAAGLAVWVVLTISRREDATGGAPAAPAGPPWPGAQVPPRPDLP
jgi:hypothetical protein